MSAKFCSVCGIALHDQSNFCPKCGVKIIKEEVGLGLDEKSKEEIGSKIGIKKESYLESSSEDTFNKESRIRPRIKTSPIWYYLPIYFSIIGGLISYFIIKKHDPKKANICLMIGIILILVIPTIWIGFRVIFGTENPFYVVSSAGMNPNLNIFDVIVVQGSVIFDHLKIGDIIVYNRPNGHDKVIVHRVAEILNKDPLVIRTKGDANPGSIPGTDFPITKDDYIGKVVYVVPQIGYVTRIFTPPINFVIIAVAFAIPIIHHWVYLNTNTKSKNIKT